MSISPRIHSAQQGDNTLDLTDIIRRAWRDADFKQHLLADPRAVIERELGVALPAGLRVHVHEQTATELHLILPAAPEPAEEAR